MFFIVLLLLYSEKNKVTYFKELEQRKLKMCELMEDLKN